MCLHRYECLDFYLYPVLSQLFRLFLTYLNMLKIPAVWFFTKFSARVILTSFRKVKIHKEAKKYQTDKKFFDYFVIH